MNKRTILYLVFLAVMAVLSIAYLQSELMILFAIFLTMPLLSLICLPFLYYGVDKKIDLSLPQTKTVDKEINGVLYVRNKSFLSIPMLEAKIVIFYPVCGIKKTIVKKFSLSGRQESKLQFSFSAGVCGPVVVKVKKIRIYDLFSIFSVSKKVNRESEIMILPKGQLISIINRDFYMGDISNLDRYHATKSGDDPSEIVGVRAYKPGDRIQKIHWKLTAKTDELMVKQLGAPFSCKIVIYVNLLCRDIKNYHERMTLVMSLGQSLLEADCIFMLLWTDKTGQIYHPVVMSPEGFYEGFALLLKTELNHSLDVFLCLEELHIEQRLRQLIIINQDMKREEIMEYMTNRKRFSDEMMLFMLGKYESAFADESLGLDMIYKLSDTKLESGLSKFELSVM